MAGRNRNKRSCHERNQNCCAAGVADQMLEHCPYAREINSLDSLCSIMNGERS
jgi:hypothetical protein